MDGGGGGGGAIYQWTREFHQIITLRVCSFSSTGGFLPCYNSSSRYHLQKRLINVIWSIFWIRPPHPFLTNAIIPSSFHSTFLLPANQSFKDGRVFYSFVDAYFMYVLWPCIMQEKLYPRPQSSVDLWIKPSIPPLIHATIPSSFHPSIPQLYIFKFLQK